MAGDNPYIDQSMLDMILNSPTPMPIGLPNDTVDDLGGWMTDINKGSNLGTDLDFLIQNGLIDPRAFEPVQTYEQVEAPGYTLMQRWGAETAAPWEQFVAGLVESGINTTGGIMKRLGEEQQKAADGDPNAQLIMESLPVALAEGADGFVLEPDPEGRPDYIQIRNDIDNLINARGSDPEYELVDGMPMARKFEDSAAAKAAQEAGYFNDPTGTYDPWAFAPEGETPEAMEQRFVGASEAMDAEQQARALYDRMAGKGGGGFSAMVGIDDIVAGMYKPRYEEPSPGTRPTPLQPSDAQRRAMSAYTLPIGNNMELNTGDSSLSMNIGPNIPGYGPVGGSIDLTPPDPRRFQNALGLSEGGPTRERVQNTVPEKRAGKSTPRPKKLIKDNLYKQKGQARLKKAQTGRNSSESIAAAESAAWRDLQRQAMVQQLAQQGYSPFYDEVRARNQAIYGR